MIEGLLTHAQENDPLPHLALEGVVLNTGSPLEIWIAGHWIAGHIERVRLIQEKRWYLDTDEDDQPLILLDPGVRARTRK